MVQNIQNCLQLISVLWVKSGHKTICHFIPSWPPSSSSPAFCWHSLMGSRYFHCITLVELPEMAFQAVCWFGLWNSQPPGNHLYSFFAFLLLSSRTSSAVLSNQERRRPDVALIWFSPFSPKISTFVTMAHNFNPKVFTHTEVDLDSSSVTCTPKNKKIKSLKKLFSGNHSKQCNASQTFYPCKIRCFDKGFPWTNSS